MLYPAQFEEVYLDEDGMAEGFVITFRDVPEAISQGYSYSEALEMAQDALRTAMQFYEESGKPLPTPGLPQHGDVLINL
jgi:antitoxin HicB